MRCDATHSIFLVFSSNNRILLQYWLKKKTKKTHQRICLTDWAKMKICFSAFALCLVFCSSCSRLYYEMKIFVYKITFAHVHQKMKKYNTVYRAWFIYMHAFLNRMKFPNASSVWSQYVKIWRVKKKKLCSSRRNKSPCNSSLLCRGSLQMGIILEVSGRQSHFTLWFLPLNIIYSLTAKHLIFWILKIRVDNFLEFIWN